MPSAPPSVNPPARSPDLMSIKTAIIPTAGRGTRLRPATNLIPKVMLPILNIPTIQYIVEEALEAGIERIILVISPEQTLIQAHFEVTEGPWQGHLHFVPQEQPLGLGHAISRGRELTQDDPFAVLFGDSVYAYTNPTKNMIEDFKVYGENLVGCQRIPWADTVKRGVMAPAPDAKERLYLSHIVEKPQREQAPSNLGHAARLIFTPTIFDALDKIEIDHTGEYQLTPAVNMLIKEEPVVAFEIEEYRLDVGNPRDYYDAVVAMGKARFGFSPAQNIRP